MEAPTNYQVNLIQPNYYRFVWAILASAIPNAIQTIFPKYGVVAGGWQFDKKNTGKSRI